MLAKGSSLTLDCYLIFGFGHQVLNPSDESHSRNVIVKKLFASITRRIAHLYGLNYTGEVVA